MYLFILYTEGSHACLLSLYCTDYTTLDTNFPSLPCSWYLHTRISHRSPSLIHASRIFPHLFYSCVAYISTGLLYTPLFICPIPLTFFRTHATLTISKPLFGSISLLFSFHFHPPPTSLSSHFPSYINTTKYHVQQIIYTLLLSLVF